MAPTPDDASHLGDRIRKAYEDLELGLIAQIARAVGRGQGSLGGALARRGALRRATRKLLDALARRLHSEMPRLIEEAYQIGADEAARGLARMRRLDEDQRPRRESPGGRGRVLPIRPPLRSRLPGPASRDELAERLIREFHPQVLRGVDDVYRRIVAEVYAPALAGQATRLEASQRALARFAEEGVSGFTDKAGRRWRIESYAEMAMRAAFARATIAGALDTYRAQGITCVAVPNIPYECEKCRPFEGKTLSITAGKPPRGVQIFTSLENAIARGFLHPNCRHGILPVSSRGVVLAMEPARPDPEGYAATQKQRAHERKIRAAKRALVAAQESGADPAALRRARDEVRRRQGDLRAFLAANPQLLRYSSREQVRRPGETIERAV
ncbi:phage minor capsid protein [Frankia sp. CeD]|uniref:phage minor capsid protein n=1 Tax=Frankia sp. CeD TaxID=258230 RepID=UPI0004DCB70E|nr:phage minor capsid protein [Frankia sp. CeD]KEZ35851.1 Phage minor capsid protein 2 [Frankia sp. CeD]